MEAICVIYMNEVSGNYIQTSSGKCMAENLKGKMDEQLWWRPRALRGLV